MSEIEQPVGGRADCRLGGTRIWRRLSCLASLSWTSAAECRALEGKTLEFKRDLSSPTKPLRTIVAFANSAGGRLVVGVDDDGTVVGVADPLAEEERITSLIAGSHLTAAGAGPSMIARR